MMPKALVNIGMPGSGKDLGREYALENGLPFFSTGDVVRSVCRQRGLVPDAKNCAEVSQQLRADGPLGVTRIAAGLALEAGAPAVVLEGMRSVDELEFLRNDFVVTVIAIVAGRGTRRARLTGRARTDDDPGQFDERDARELDYGVGEAIALADEYLRNEGTLKEAKQAYERIAAEALQRA